MTSEPIKSPVPQCEPFTVIGSGGVRLVGDRWAAPDPAGTGLLLHGGGQTRHSWARTGQRLAQTGGDAIAMDTRGHGDSDWGAGPDDYEMDSLVADLVAVVAAIGEKPVVIGASMGGMTALVGEGESAGGDTSQQREPDGMLHDVLPLGPEGTPPD